MTKELFQKRDIDKTPDDVDADEKKVPRVTLDSVVQDGRVQRAFVDTRIRSNDKTRYLYVLVEGCDVSSVIEYITALRSGKITGDNLSTYIPDGASICDIMPLAAQPRIEINRGM